jgi:hypothetical protein
MSTPSTENKTNGQTSSSKLTSHVRLTNLEERIVPLPRAYTSISILKPVIYIEREVDAKGLMLHEAASASAAQKFDDEKFRNFEFTDSESDDEVIKNTSLRKKKRPKVKDFKPKEQFRISTSFTIEAEILGFNQP